MAESLPLLLEKGGAVCADVRGVLREVFRELDYLPPTAEPSGIDRERLQPANIQDPDHKKIYEQERELQREYAKRLARDPLPNIYQLHKPITTIKEDAWEKDELKILERKDLRPPINQEAGGDRSLWVQNILNRSSGDITTLKVAGSRVPLPVTLGFPDENTVQSVSFGELAPRRVPRPLSIAPPPPPQDYIVCIPPRLDFINFVVGQLHTKSLRLVNISKFEARLSLRPPARRELDVQLCSRLVVTSGSTTELRLHFRPSDVRTFDDELLVRVSNGHSLSVPIACYMESPKLSISIPLPTFPCLSTVKSSVISSTDTVELGARLLGEVHRVPFLLHCDEGHASFFILSEDLWNEFCVKVSSNSVTAGVATDCFYWSPARWAGGSTRGQVQCRGTKPGLHIASMRILSSTAIVRSLNLVADFVLFSPDHITLEAQEKDYDIRSEDDPACEHYVNLGVTFPHRPLAATVKVVNKSPLMYTYYWRLRPWGVCSCWEDSKIPGEEDESDLCPGARQAKFKKQSGQVLYDEAMRAVVIEPTSGCLAPCSVSTAHVLVPDVGAELRMRRAVLMLILRGVPKESFASNFVPMIVKTEVVEEEGIPGVSPRWSREVCEVVCAQLEVWWEVVPVRFALDPPLIRLPHSRRVKSVAVSFRSTQLYGASNVRATWQGLHPEPPPLLLMPQQTVLTTIMVPLAELPNELPRFHRITLVAESEEWQSCCRIERWCSTRHLKVLPAATWLGVVPPGATVTADLRVVNDTHQNISWWAKCHRWHRERESGAACVGRVPCTTCHNRACACAILSPSSGRLMHSQRSALKYRVNAPNTDGCVVSLVVVGRAGGASAEDARASLVAYRVLAPRLVLRVLPCHGDKKRECEGCALDFSPGGALEGSALLRPSAALSLGDQSCCRLQLRNLTPLPTTVKWAPAIDGEDIIAVTFIPNEVPVAGNSTVELLVVLEARRVCDRRLFVLQAAVQYAYKPIYLLIDAAVSGSELMVEFPIGGDERTESVVTIKMIQKEEVPYRKKSYISSNPEEIFAEEDRQRDLQKENICHCHYKMIYVPTVRSTVQHPEEQGENSPIEILEVPPSLTRVCPCAGWEKPNVPDEIEPYCLQFRNLPIRTVRSRTLVLRNVSRMDARWRAAVRRWPRRHTRTVDKEQWAGDVHPPGVVLQCTPAEGTLGARNSVQVQVAVYTDCWGLYRDQILIQVENVEPLVIDVWIESVGEPLQFALRPVGAHPAPPVLWSSHHTQPKTPPPVIDTTTTKNSTIVSPRNRSIIRRIGFWRRLGIRVVICPACVRMSYADPERIVHVTNTSRADLITYVYLLKENEYPQDELPFRVYLRLFDVTPRTCPCVMEFDYSKETETPSCCSEDMDTGVDLFLAPDYGVQEECFYRVEPLQMHIKSGARVTLSVRRMRRHGLAPPGVLLLRSAVETRTGPGWYRLPPQLQVLQLREAQRTPQLQVSCSDLRVCLCALDLPADEILRVRKRFRVQNIGDGPLQTRAVAEPPWSVDRAFSTCSAHCARGDRSGQRGELRIELRARSSTEDSAKPIVLKLAFSADSDDYGTLTQHIAFWLFVEVSLNTAELWPASNTTYSPRKITTTSLLFYNDEDILLSIPLVLELDMPVLKALPAIIDFGFVNIDSTRKSFFTVSHSSPTATVELVTQWVGDEQFQLYPPSLILKPAATERVYVQYTASHISAGSTQGYAHVRAVHAWCAASVLVVARRTLAAARELHPDRTDDPHLLPADVIRSLR